jgi:hypothetical protein
MNDIIADFFVQRPNRIVADMPFAEYQQIRAINASVLKEPTRKQMRAAIVGMDSLPAQDRAELELLGGDASDVLARVEELTPRTIPCRFVKATLKPSAKKLSPAQNAVLDACTIEPVDARQFNGKTLAILKDAGLVDFEDREVTETRVSEAQQESRAFNLTVGTLVHAAILEPHAFDSDKWQSRFQLSPSKGLTSKLALEALAENPHLQLVTPEIIDTARRARDAVWAHDEARYLLEQLGQSEVTVEAWDATYGIMRKCRIDRLPADPAMGILDIKTCQELGTRTSHHKLKSTVYSWLYHVQHAHYIDTLALVEKQFRPWWSYLWVTKKAPFMARVSHCPTPLDTRGMLEPDMMRGDENFYAKGSEVSGESIAEFCLGYLEGDWSAFEREESARGPASSTPVLKP